MLQYTKFDFFVHLFGKISVPPAITMSNYCINGENVAVHEEYSEALGFSRLYTADGRLLVLVTNSYGAGWSTNAGISADNLLMDARIVRFFYETYVSPRLVKLDSREVRFWKLDEAPMKAFLEQLGFEYVYLGGLSNLDIEFVPPNSKFRVTEYDGLESIVIYNPEKWFTS